GPALAAPADGQRLPGREGEALGQFRRHVEGHRGGVVGERVDPRHGERVEFGPGPGHQISLTYSKGSRQLSQRYRALHAVPLNAAVCLVAAEPHRGQGTGSRRVRPSGTRTGPGSRGAWCGGATPAWRSL